MTLGPAVESLLAMVRSQGRGPSGSHDHLRNKLSAYLGKMADLPGHFYYVYSLVEGRIIYHSGIDKVLGIVGDIDVEGLYRACHPDDAPLVALLNEAVIRTLTALPVHGDPFDMCLTLDYRMCKATGEHIRVLRRSLVFEVDPTSKVIKSTISLCKDITAIKTNGPVCWNIMGEPSDHPIDLSALQEHLSRIQYAPSPRELQVLRELAKGNSSKLIADSLHISVHTVNTHRRNLLDRTGLANSAELMNKAAELGWLGESLGSH